MKKNKLKPLLKWSGGKTTEIDIIHKFMPEDFNRFYEPFIGGGAVWLSIDSDKEMLVNDLSEDLINLYTNVKNQDKEMFNFLYQFKELWRHVGEFSIDNQKHLTDLFVQFKEGDIDLLDLEQNLKQTIEQADISFYFMNSDFKGIVLKSLFQKYKRMLLNEKKKGAVDYTGHIHNIETGLKSGVYTFIRNIYNQERTGKIKLNSGIQSAVYFIIRDLCYSGMFRFNKNNEFNVPYGGTSYNKKDFINKIGKLKNPDVIHHFNSTLICQGDFYDFMKNNPPEKDDFIFLDPPYDTEFSDYDGNDFDHNDQSRLANYLINECKGKWMMVIKRTDFIFDLYNNKENIKILSFNKNYSVSFMNRNDRNVDHLIILNY